MAAQVRFHYEPVVMQYLIQLHAIHVYFVHYDTKVAL